MWHITCDTWNMTCDTWHVTCCGGWTFFKNCISLALTVCDLWYYEDLEEKAHGINQWINHKAVYRTAPATPGLLIIVVLQLLLIQLCYTLLVQTHLPLHLQYICHCICNSFVTAFAIHLQTYLQLCMYSFHRIVLDTFAVAVAIYFANYISRLNFEKYTGYPF